MDAALGESGNGESHDAEECGEETHGDFWRAKNERRLGDKQATKLGELEG